MVQYGELLAHGWWVAGESVGIETGQQRRGETQKGKERVEKDIRGEKEGRASKKPNGTDVGNLVLNFSSQTVGD